MPAFLHQEFQRKLPPQLQNGDEGDLALRGWYARVDAEYADRAIGDTDVEFWRKRFREWVGVTCARADPGRRLRAVTDQVTTWDAVRERLLVELPRRALDEWFGQTVLVTETAQQLVVRAPPDVAIWIQRHYAEPLRRTLDHVCPGRTLDWVAEAVAPAAGEEDVRCAVT